jgi:hypothetical protein
VPPKRCTCTVCLNIGLLFDVVAVQRCATRAIYPQDVLRPTRPSRSRQTYLPLLDLSEQPDIHGASTFLRAAPCLLIEPGSPPGLDCVAAPGLHYVAAPGLHCLAAPGLHYVAAPGLHCVAALAFIAWQPLAFIAWQPLAFIVWQPLAFST